MGLRYTKQERNWVMYDVGNSALVLLNTSVVPIYFNAINTGADSAAAVTAWANAQTIASLAVALLMPILGSLADYAGNKIKFFTGFSSPAWSCAWHRPSPCPPWCSLPSTCCAPSALTRP